MKVEDLRYVISVLKGDEPTGHPDWYTVLGFLTCHRVAGLFYNRAQKQGVLLPKKIESILQSMFEAQKRKVVFMREQIRIITEKLSSVDASYMLLKGSVLSNLAMDDFTIYEDGERSSNDIDLLVSSEEIAAVNKALCELGFVQGRYISKDNSIEEFSRLEIVKRRMNRGEIAPFVKKTDNAEIPFVEIDVNFSLGNTPLEKVALLNEMVSCSAVCEGKVSMRVPSEELFFLHLIMHQYKESCLFFMVSRSKDLDLYKLADIYYIFKADVLNVQRLNELINKHVLQKEVGVVLNQVGEIFEDEEILNYASTFGTQPPIVIDYENKKAYHWKATAQERIRAFQMKEALEEVQYDY